MAEGFSNERTAKGELVDTKLGWEISAVLVAFIPLSDGKTLLRQEWRSILSCWLRL